MEVWPGPTEETFKLLQEQWPTKGKKQEQVSLVVLLDLLQTY